MDKNTQIVTSNGNTMSAKDYKKWIDGKAKEYAEENQRIVERYMSELNKTNDENKAIATVCDAFECTPVRVKNQVAKVTGHLNPATKALTEAKLLVYMDKLNNMVDSAIEYGIERLEKLGGLEDDDMLLVETGKHDKKIPVWEQKKREYKDLINHQQEVFKAIKSLLPQTVLNNVINNTSDVSRMTDADLDRELEIENGRYRKGEKS